MWLAFFAFLGWGFGDLFVTLNSRELGSSSAAVWRTMLTLFLYTIFLVFGVFSIQFPSGSTALLLLFLIIVGNAGILTFYEGLRRGKAAIVGTIASCFSAVVVILSIIVFREPFTWIDATATLLILLGIICASLPNLNIQKSLLHEQGTSWALAALFCWGIYFTFVRIPAREIGAFSTSYICLAGFLISMIPIMKMRKETLKIPMKTGTWIRVVLHSMVILVAELSYNTAIITQNASLVAPIASAYPILFVLLAHVFLKETLHRHQYVGILLAISGVITLAL